MLRAFADGPHRAGEIAEPVGRENRGAVERRDEIRAGHVGRVVLDAMKSAQRIFSGATSKADARSSRMPAKRFITRSAVERKPRHAHGVAEFRAEARPRIARHGDVIHFRQFCARRVQAKLDSARRKSRGVFHAVQALFFDGGNEAAVDDDRRGSVRVIRVDPKNDHLECVSQFAVERIASCGRNRGRASDAVRL